MAISKEIIQQEHSSIQLSVTVDAPEVRGQYDELVASYAKKVQIPGFRKGKVPKDILERKLGDSLKGEALGHIMEKAVQEILGAEDFPAEQRPLPYSTPALREEPAFDPDKDLTFSVYYDIFPSIKVGEWKGIEVESPVADISNDDIQLELEQIRERNGIVMDKEEGAGAEKSDVATVDYAELGDDGEILPGSERQDFVFTIGTGYNIYKFDDEVMGMKAGETKDIEKTFDEDYEYSDLAGQKKTHPHKSKKSEV